MPLLRRLLTEEHVSHEGRFWQLSGVTVSPRPARPPRLWIGASARVAVSRAGRIGNAWLAAPGATGAQLRDQLAWYREAADTEDRLAEVETFPVRRDVYIAASDAEAAALAGPIIERGYRGFDPEVLIVGGPRDRHRPPARVGGDGLSTTPSSASCPWARTPSWSRSRASAAT